MSDRLKRTHRFPKQEEDRRLLGRQRRASWLELFYDLAYVAAIAQLTYFIAQRQTWWEIVGVVFVFLIIYFSWLNPTIFVNIFGRETQFLRIAMQVQMFFALVMSVFVARVYDGGATGFIVGYVGIRLVLLGMFFHHYRVNPERRPKTYNIVTGFSLSTFAWMVSIFVEPPFQYLIWVLAIVLDVATPFTYGRGNKKVILNTEHLTERLGLFTLLVMGESVVVVAIVGSLTPLEGIVPVGIAVGGFLIMLALWWLYFPTVNAFISGKRLRSLFGFFYSHSLLFLGILTFAVGVKFLLTNPYLLEGFLFSIVGVGFMMFGYFWIKLSSGIAIRLCGVNFLKGVAVLLLAYGVSYYSIPFAFVLLVLVFWVYVLYERKILQGIEE